MVKREVDRGIDGLVASRELSPTGMIYELTEEEIKIVEEIGKRTSLVGVLTDLV